MLLRSVMAEFSLGCQALEAAQARRAGTRPLGTANQQHSLLRGGGYTEKNAIRTPSPESFHSQRSAAFTTPQPTASSALGVQGPFHEFVETGINPSVYFGAKATLKSTHGFSMTHTPYETSYKLWNFLAPKHASLFIPRLRGLFQVVTSAHLLPRSPRQVPSSRPARPGPAAPPGLQS